MPALEMVSRQVPSCLSYLFLDLSRALRASNMLAFFLIGRSSPACVCTSVKRAESAPTVDGLAWSHHEERLQRMLHLSRLLQS